MLRTLLQRRTLAYVAVIAVLVLAVGGGYSLAANSSAGTIKVCVSKGTGVLKLAHGKCKHGARSLSWNKAGLRGPAGTNGSNGTNGTNGSNGTNAASHIVVRLGGSASGVSTGGTIITATCNAGETATGGGAKANSTNGVIIDSYPKTGGGVSTAGQTPNAWELDVKTTSSTADFQSYVICAS